MSEPVPGRPCPVCGLPDPDHDWDVHDAAPAAPAPVEPEQRYGAALPNMLTRASTRGGHSVRVLALHTTEGILRASDLRAWAAWAGSSHAAADAGGVLLTPAHGFVPYHLAAWTLRSGNPWSENIELCGFAAWGRVDWLARPSLLECAARWLADRSQARGVPLRKITPQQYRAGAAGVIAHHDHTVGYSDGTHWDVGTSFPWDVVLPRAQAIATNTEDDVLTNDQNLMLTQLHQVLFSGSTQTPQPLTVYRRLVDVQAALTNALPVLLRGADVDEQALAAALAPLLSGPLVAAVVDELAGVDGLNAAEAEAAAERAVRRVLGSVDA